MSSTHSCPKDGCTYSGGEHGLKTHLAQQHEDSKYGRVTLSCDTCNKTFEKARHTIKNNNNSFCSSECQNNYTKEERQCVVCGETEYVNSSEYVHENGWVCSKKCNKEQYRDKVECVICGNKERELSYEVDPKSYTCSNKCRNEFYNPTTICEYCGNTFTRGRSRINQSDKNYCSRECSDKAKGFSVNNRADTREHNRWAKKIKEMADYVCEDCGESYSVMCAHHSPPKHELSKSEQTNVENGICLCYPCHAERHTGPQKMALLGWWDWYTST